MQPLVDTHALDKSRIRVTVRGSLLMCTSEEVEGARLRQLNLLHRTRRLREDGAIIKEIAEVNFPYVERYVVLESIGESLPIESFSDECSNQMACEEATLHSYSSLDEYQRRRNSARKKDRLRVDRLVDSRSSVDSSCDFQADALDGKRVLKTWYFRAPSPEVKGQWLNKMKIVCS